jgi:hypothetical protein
MFVGGKAKWTILDTSKFLGTFHKRYISSALRWFMQTRREVFQLHRNECEIFGPTDWYNLSGRKQNEWIQIFARAYALKEKTHGHFEVCKLYFSNYTYFVNYEARPQSKFRTRPTASNPYLRDRAMMWLDIGVLLEEFAWQSRSKNSFTAFIVLEGRKEKSHGNEDCNGEIVIWGPTLFSILGKQTRDIDCTCRRYKRHVGWNMWCTGEVGCLNVNGKIILKMCWNTFCWCHNTECRWICSRNTTVSSDAQHSGALWEPEHGMLLNLQ